MPLQATSGGASYDAFGGGAAAVPTYIEDVFSTWLYTGTGSAQTITNGIDLAGKGGMVWIKSRSNAYNHWVVDSARGTGNDKPRLQTNTTAAQSLLASTAFGATGFTVYGDSDYNDNGATFASWTFRKQPKFFDVVTYTGNGANRTIAHNLGSVPGCIIVKRTDTTAAWAVYHRSLANTEYLVLNTTAAKATGTTYWNSTTATSTDFSLGTATDVNANGGTYVAYLFAHDAGGFGLTGTDNVISCGSFTSDGSGNATVSLGYEPQWIMAKRTSGVDDWYIWDTMRGLPLGGAALQLLPNSSRTEETSGSSTFNLAPTATGFRSAQFFGANSTYIYIAIRRGPMKTPTTGTSVFQPTVYTGTNVDNRLVDTTIAPDMVWVRQRNDTVLAGMVVGDRLRGQPYLLTGSGSAEVDDADAFDAQIVSGTEYGTAFSAMNGFYCGNDPTAKLNVNTTSNNHIAEAFKRAPGFFDEVCYTGTGASLTLNHNLGVTPELVISKRRSGVYDWTVYSSARGTANTLFLNLTNAETAYTSVSAATSTTFTVEGVASAGGETFVAYLFASCPGVSKVGSYTGTGTTKQIDCGFTGGARWVMIKRTDSTGDWYVWDSARGIVAGNDPYLLLNSTAAEVTNTDYVDTYSAGFEISSTAPAAINANGGTFIFLAIA